MTLARALGEEGVLTAVSRPGAHCGNCSVCAADDFGIVTVDCGPVIAMAPTHTGHPGHLTQQRSGVQSWSTGRSLGPVLLFLWDEIL